MDDDDDIYGPEDLEMEDDNEEAIEMGDDELQFDDDQEESDTTPFSESGSKSDQSMDKLVDTSDSNRSQDIITASIDDSSAKSESDRYEESKTPAGSLEMVDLSKKSGNKRFDQGEMREFKPAGTVNQSQKKREKRKAKK